MKGSTWILVWAEKNFRFGVRFLPPNRPASIESREIPDGLIQKEVVLSAPPRIWCILEISPAKLSVAGIVCEKQVTDTNNTEINKQLRVRNSRQGWSAKLRIINAIGFYFIQFIIFYLRIK